MNLGGGFGETAPSHPAQSVGSLPCPEYLLDPGTHAMYGLVQWLKTISVNSEICSIGSANIEIRSFSVNYELNAVLYSRR